MSEIIYFFITLKMILFITLPIMIAACCFITVVEKINSAKKDIAQTKAPITGNTGKCNKSKIAASVSTYNVPD